MKTIIKNTTWFILAILVLGACKIEEQVDPNGPSKKAIEDDATIGDIQNVAAGIEAGMRNDLDMYLNGVGVIGREYYRFSSSDPRLTSDLLGKGSATLDNNTFYTTRSYASRYRVVRNCWILIHAVQNTTADIKPKEVNGAIGFAKTIMAYQLLLNLNQMYLNGIRVDVEDPDNLGPIVSYEKALQKIMDMLDEANGLLNSAGNDFIFSLSTGFTDFNTPTTFNTFNRAIAARVALYQKNNSKALNLLNESFYDITGDFNTGVYHVFSTAGADVLNPMFLPLNSSGEVRAAHPSFVTDMEDTLNDDRFAKVSRRDDEWVGDGLNSFYDENVYSSNVDNIPIIRNEELILIYAEANINISPTETVAAIDAIRTGHGLPAYSGGTSAAELTDEVLTQRRYSLYAEGHRWIDMRRFDRLDDLPIDRPDDDVWKQFPLPATEDTGS